MSRRLLIVEPDASTRVLMDRVLTAAGYTAEDFASAYDARILLDDAAFDLAVVDEFGASGTMLEEVRFLRAEYPTLPLVVTGTFLTQSALIQLIRLGVHDVLLKPYLPDDLRDAVSRVLVRATPRHAEALDYAAALDAARDALASGHPDVSAKPLARAWAVSPLDPDVVSLEALRAELEGRDGDASRGYRAALALRHDAAPLAGADPYDGLARLAGYGPARPTAHPSAEYRAAPRRLHADSTRESANAPATEHPTVEVLAVGLSDSPDRHVYFREGGGRMFALVPSDGTAEQSMAMVDKALRKEKTHEQ